MIKGPYKIDRGLEIDRKTMEDLNILPCKNSYSLLNLLYNRCKTSDAKQILKKIVTAPMSDPHIIIDRQIEIAFIIKNIAELSRINIDDDFVYTSRNYLNSNIIALNKPNKFIAFASSFGYRHYIPTLIKGIRCLLSITPQLEHILYFHETEIPHGLRNTFNSIRIFIEMINLSEVYKITHKEYFSDTDVLLCDSVLRGKLLNRSRDLINYLIELDALIALAKLNIDFNLKFPIFCNNKMPIVKIVELKHLAITNCKPITVNLGESFNLIYLTGPNMSGKSSLLKAFGCAVLLAHLGMGVPATEMTLTPFDGILADINNEDSISEGQSYFLSEVLRVKTITEKVITKKKFLVICDELFRGTNIIDASDCTETIVNGFQSQKKSLFLIASHIHSIKSKIHNDNSIGWYYFESTVENGKPLFAYMLKEGISDSRYGLLILKNQGVCDLFMKN